MSDLERVRESWATFARELNHLGFSAIYARLDDGRLRCQWSYNPRNFNFGHNSHDHYFNLFRESGTLDTPEPRSTSLTQVQVETLRKHGEGRKLILPESPLSHLIARLMADYPAQLVRWNNSKHVVLGQFTAASLNKVSVVIPSELLRNNPVLVKGLWEGMGGEWQSGDRQPGTIQSFTI